MIDMKKRLFLRKYIRSILQESKASEQFEQDVANAIDASSSNVIALKMGDVRLSDIKVQIGDISSYVEAKMTHSDNLANPRIYFNGSVWDTTYDTPVAAKAVELANTSQMAADFLDDLRLFLGRNKITLPTTKGGLRIPSSPTYLEMVNFFSNRDSQYFVREPDVNIGDLVTQHYLFGKSEPAHYMQSGNDFYLIGSEDPFNLQSRMPADQKGTKVKIPQLAGIGDFKIRVSMRASGQWYEVQAEIKIKNFMPSFSPSSVLDDVKINPFLYV
jgi:hypothetical protein